MSDDEILELLARYYDEARLDMQGGYPSQIDSKTIRGWVVVATDDHDDAPELNLHRWSRLRRWVRSAIAMQKEEPEVELIDCLHEVGLD